MKRDILILFIRHMYLHMEEVADYIFPYLSLRAKNHTVFSLRSAWILDSELNLGELEPEEIKRGKKLRQVITEEQTKVHRYDLMILHKFCFPSFCSSQSVYSSETIHWSFIY